jgi:cellulose synthase/poly-beta-1,6-N-acetylglucosamine synthase-like glycosyltransferase
MTALLLCLTLLGLLVPVYVYAGYPLVLRWLSRVRPPRTVRRAEIEPRVAFFVSCYNEEAVLEKKIQNCLAIDYPPDRIEFIFISDGSNDRTDEIVRAWTNRGIRLIRQEGRLGKTSGLNLGIAATDAEIAIFSDANAMYDTRAVRMLVRNFHDPEVGYVVGAALYTDGKDNAAAASENAYWEYELALKEMESNLHSVVGGDGAIYAIRRALYEPLAREDINDFVNPLQIIAKGYRGVFDREATCFEETAGDFDKEGRRKERIVNRSFRGLMKVKEVMNPFQVGFYAFEIISHKLLRWLVPFFLTLFTVGSILLSLAGISLFDYIVVLGLLFLWLALGGYLWPGAHPPAPLYYPYYFLLVNLMSARGVIAALRGNIQVTWNTHRSGDQNQGPARQLLWLGGFLFCSLWLMQHTLQKIMA